MTRSLIGQLLMSYTICCPTKRRIETVRIAEDSYEDTLSEIEKVLDTVRVIPCFPSVCNSFMIEGPQIKARHGHIHIYFIVCVFCLFLVLFVL